MCYIHTTEYYSALKSAPSHYGYRMPDRLRMPLEAIGAVLVNMSLK